MVVEYLNIIKVYRLLLEERGKMSLFQVLTLEKDVPINRNVVRNDLFFSKWYLLTNITNIKKKFIRILCHNFLPRDFSV